MEPIKLEEIADCLDSTSVDFAYYLDRATGEIILDADGAFEGTEEEIEAQKERLEFSPDIIGLPEPWDINDYGTMLRFARQMTDGYVQEKLLDALRSKKSYRQFKNAMYHYGVSNEYYAFRQAHLMQLAKEWCESNDIPYVEEKGTE